MSNLRTGEYGSYYGSYFDESVSLSQSQMEKNVSYIFSYLTAQGWTKQSIAAIVGNMQAESSINPGRWQSNDVGNTEMGYSLVQWTPATKYINWCESTGRGDPSEMDNALDRIIYELENGVQWYATETYDMTFREFTKSTLSPSTLAKAFVLNYERPADQSAEHLAYRGGLANNWYTYLTGETPQPGTGGVSTHLAKRGKYKFLLFRKKSWRV